MSKTAKSTQDSYWDYLQQNSKEVSSWPSWLGGEQDGTKKQECPAESEKKTQSK